MKNATLIGNKFTDLVMEAAELYDLDLNDVERSDIDRLIATKQRHDKVFEQGSGRSYRVTANGTVGFLNASGKMI
jgi:hypothetical protein